MMDEPLDGAGTEEATTERVRDLLAVSSRLFATKGFKATSMRDIATEAGVSKALLYHHFASKDDIYARISFESTQHLYSFVKSRIPEDAGAADKVRAYMTAAAEFFADHRSAWIAASNAFWTDPDRQRMARRVARRRDFEHLLRH
ncbi:MAG: TetR/AcrR family transcriptional regulator, partial [Alphaproteobacteria bacterium]|nr:TetR/AcrR family transcriptional regulator [Alphaproteobacteria bacterium]